MPYPCDHAPIRNPHADADPEPTATAEAVEEVRWRLRMAVQDLDVLERATSVQTQYRAAEALQALNLHGAPKALARLLAVMIDEGADPDDTLLAMARATQRSRNLAGLPRRLTPMDVRRTSR